MVRSFDILTFIVIFASQAAAVFKIEQCSSNDWNRLDKAQREAQSVASKALDALNSGKIDNNEATFHGAYDPVFQPGARDQVKKVFERIGEIATSQDYIVTFYCTNDHVKLETHDASGEQWYDTAFINSGTENNGIAIPAVIDQDPAEKRLGKKPGDSESFTVLGWAPDAPKKDFSNQAHIFIENGAINPPNDSPFDTRWLYEIVDQGFARGKSMIDNIRGPTTTVLHELVHVAGGLISPNSRGANIDDGPSGVVYTWLYCFMANTQQEARDMGLKTEKYADCYAMFAQACYLQIKKTNNPPTCWNTGKVFPDTLESVPADQPVPQKRSTVSEARARWHARSLA
ncbi:hypothetical protein BDV95DRAFT_106604 [Massariosphaeria phaeospora]|uniref:Peptidase M43 pregnancy-associated plasma-A domain-containing protein n=1 Tax=Massariosphaeria phaeospora TaxID=100035 RepID=A0A7C8MBF4_9PLEO|nr:hypothetical protein BDV95DRAFT_106604 [Massariosphaeria phaeospora]